MRNRFLFVCVALVCVCLCASAEPPANPAPSPSKVDAIFADKSLSLSQKNAAVRALAEAGDAQAQCRLGLIVFYHGADANGKNPAEGWAWLEKSAQQGNREAVSMLAMWEDEGHSPAREDPLRWRLKAAEAGDAFAQDRLADLYQSGRIAGVPRDEAKSLEWRTRAALGGNASARRALAEYYAQGADMSDTPRDISAALHWWRMGAQEGDALSQLGLAELLFCLPEEPENLQEAARWLEKASAQKKLGALARSRWGLALWFGWGVPRDVPAAMKIFDQYDKAQPPVGMFERMAQAYLFGDGVPADPEKARACYLRVLGQFSHLYYLTPHLNGPLYPSDEELPALRALAESGDIFAAYRLGCASRMQNPKEGSRWLKLAADGGHAMAQYELACTLLSWDDGVPDPKTRAVEWLRKSAAAGMAVSAYKLSECCYEGRGVARDKAAALLWLRRAADQGLPEAMVTMGDAFAEGVLTAQDFKQARNWYASARNGGAVSPRFRVRLGNLYAYGLGGDANFEKAIFYYRDSVESPSGGYFPDAHGARALALCYASGRGLPPDAAEAFRLFRVAAEQGDVDAVYQLGRCYAEGLGTQKNAAKAEACLRESARIECSPYSTKCYMNNVITRLFQEGKNPKGNE